MAGIDFGDYDIDPADDMSNTPFEQHQLGPSLRDELEEGQQRRELTEDKVRSLYQSLGQKPPEAIYSDDFEVKKKHLYFINDKGERIPLTHNPSKFVSMGTINQRLSASERDRLGFIKPKLDREAVAKLQNIQQELLTDNQIQNIELEDLSQTADRIINTIEAETTEEEEAAFKNYTRSTAAHAGNTGAYKRIKSP